MTPGIAGIPWAEVQVSDDGLRQTPILSIIQLNFPPEADIQGCQSAARFWEASLDYVDSIPNCTALYWAPLQNDPSSVIVLLQWEDVFAWGRFQNSASFALVISLLTPNCVNRALRAELPVGIDLTNRTLEIASFEFSANDAGESSQLFLRSWEDFSNSVAFDASDRVNCLGACVEPDAPCSISPEDRAKADIQPRYFVVLMFWKSGNEDAGSALREKAATLSDSNGAIGSAITTVSLRTHSSGKNHGQSVSSVSSAMAVETTSSLLSNSCERRYRSDNGFWKSHDRVCSRSISDQLARKRLYPCPRGIYLVAGGINRYEILTEGRPKVSAPTADIFWVESRLSESSSDQEWWHLGELLAYAI